MIEVQIMAATFSNRILKRCCKKEIAQNTTFYRPIDHKRRRWGQGA